MFRETVRGRRWAGAIGAATSKRDVVRMELVGNWQRAFSDVVNSVWIWIATARSSR
jgi:hypothetical protein